MGKRWDKFIKAMGEAGSPMYYPMPMMRPTPMRPICDVVGHRFDIHDVTCVGADGEVKRTLNRVYICRSCGKRTEVNPGVKCNAIEGESDDRRHADPDPCD